MADYAANSKKSKETAVERPKVEKITTGEVLMQKKGLGGKFKDFFIATDFKSVVTYVVWDVCLPAMKDMLVDSAYNGMKKMMYGDRPGANRYRASSQSYQSYQTMPQRGVGLTTFGGTRDNLDRRGLPGRGMPADPRSRNQSVNTGIILATREDADQILERMALIIDGYDVVTVAELYELCGMQSTPVDVVWGWSDLRSAQVQQIREGYLLDLPQPQSLR